MLRTVFLLVIFILTVNIAGVGALESKPASPSDNATAIEETASQQLARSRLLKMASFLADQEKFVVTVRAGFDVVQKNGQKIEFGETREILLERPNRVRIEELASHGGRNLMLFDGKEITMHDADSGCYAQAPQPGSIDATVVYFVRDLKMRLPLAPLLMQTLPQELKRRVLIVDDVERTEILGQTAYHVAGCTANVDFQIWIAEGERPLPLRIILSYVKAEGHPQFWADFSAWNFSPEITSKTFIFEPPAKAKKILFAAQFQPSTDNPEPNQAEDQGGKQ